MGKSQCLKGAIIAGCLIVIGIVWSKQLHAAYGFSDWPWMLAIAFVSLAGYVLMDVPRFASGAGRALAESREYLGALPGQVKAIAAECYQGSKSSLRTLYHDYKAWVPNKLYWRSKLLAFEVALVIAVNTALLFFVSCGVSPDEALLPERAWIAASYAATVLAVFAALASAAVLLASPLESDYPKKRAYRRALIRSIRSRQKIVFWGNPFALLLVLYAAIWTVVAAIGTSTRMLIARIARAVWADRALVLLWTAVLLIQTVLYMYVVAAEFARLMKRVGVYTYSEKAVLVMSHTALGSLIGFFVCSTVPELFAAGVIGAVVGGIQCRYVRPRLLGLVQAVS